MKKITPLPKSLAVLVVDDDPDQRHLLHLLLTRAGHTVAAAGSEAEARSLLDTAAFDLALLDVYLGDDNGLHLLRHLKRQYPETSAIMMTARASVPAAVEALRAGAEDFLVKPLQGDLLLAKLAQVSRQAILEQKVRIPGPEGSARPDPEIIGSSKLFRETLEQVRRAAAGDGPVLFQGESGTGKELLARHLHHLGRRRDGPFVPVNCGAIPENLAESELFGHLRGAFTGADRNRPGRIVDADGGTLFLDEIGELPLHLQPKLLRVVQDGEVYPVGGNTPRKVNVRWVAATHQNLRRMIGRGTFREDLFFRLSVIPIVIPPLRRRGRDIEELMRASLARKALHYHGEPKDLAPETLALLRKHPWPGNVRELENLAERLVLLNPGPIVTPGDLPREFDGFVETKPGGQGSLPAALSRLELRLIRIALRECRGHQSRAAARLGISERKLRYLLRKHGIPAARDEG